MLRRAALTWIMMIPVAVLNGVIREKLVRPLTGELPAHQISVATGSVGLFGVVYTMWHRDAERLDDPLLRKTGAAWMLATVMFEFGLGAARGMAWSEMLRDYNVRAGRLWTVVLTVIAVSPLAVKRWVMRRHHSWYTVVAA
jgi:hypothetical protein